MLVTKIKLLILSLLMLIALPQLALAVESVDCFQYYKFQDGLIFDDLHAEKVSYSPDDEVIISYNLLSQMEVPIVEGRVRVQIFYNDPKQREQMIDEFFAFKNLSLKLNDKISQELRWTVPKGAKEGEYIIKTYFVVGDFFNLAGISFLSYGPPGMPGGQTTFNVENPSTSRVYFSKEDTYINDVKYEFGAFSPGYNRTETITIKTQLVSGGEPKQVNLELEIYEWDDLTEKPMSKHTVKKTISLESNGRGDIIYELPALDVGTYLVKFIAKSGEEKSIIKLRLSVGGAKGRFIYLGLDKFPLIKDQKTTIFFCLSNSADYTTSFTGKGTIEIVDENENSIFKESYGPIDVVPDPMGKKSEFTPTQTYTKLILKIDLYDEKGNFMDKLFLTYDYSKFQNIPSTFDLQLNKTNFKKGETLSYTLKYDDDFGKPLDGKILLYLTNQEGNIVYKASDKEIHGSLTGSIKLLDKIGQYKLTARELTHDLKTEKTFTLEEPAEGEFNYWWLIGIIIIIVLLFISLKVMKR
ncbi:MAG: hypothetical protein KAU95_03365 [Candidatus Aenigmarchaeota archaeon]|nr:hypothetical protein [Candidatus Aenigmarchaeota archaeon]